MCPDAGVEGGRGGRGGRGDTPAREGGAGDRSLPPLIVIVGPTAVGKTALSLLLAERLPVEVVSADSTQVYRGLDIGTDKVDPEIRLRIPHHLIDIRNPDEPYSVAEFRRDAAAAIADIRRRGRYPVLVGGTGYYVTALLLGYDFEPVPPDPELRRQLEEDYDRLGPEALHRRLAAVDPQRAAAIHPHDRKRLVRALEIWHRTGQPPSRFHPPRDGPLAFDARCYGLTDDRRRVYRAIEERVDRQLARGLVEEVRRLLDAGYSPSLPALQALGYKEIIGYLRGEYDLAEARRRLIRNTRRYAKRQWTWFRHQLPGIRWFDRSRWSLPEIARRIAGEVRGTVDGSKEGPGGPGTAAGKG
ncbi:tRNA delta(2)-isopentenylpyrophosphate transferase [Thermaerobacter marianensis DSM 12885]|uniref:tRNA dimethylallyltransferase n=1 Tax=Thermaerobacter marianensis (strain ATCC 700841 / DSM 12885 / JCM 10246 / 7p75a) TaxID=644966 RepID=E6SK48_THEM7|nr:tRNA (adenosine(37)-N6)-dimethylallyltransferase MiaA [Thermaerobacter marianensis]ADU51189.1 tRNA delta(2)-isopentenylpyrophosphate transferase [Thermaerobacter marianensis DSM 12885]